MKRYTCVFGSGVQLFGIVVIDILLMQSIRMVLEVHLWLGLRTLFWLRVSLYLKIFVKKKCFLCVYWNLRRPVCGLFGCDQYHLSKRECFVSMLYICVET